MLVRFCLIVALVFAALAPRLASANVSGDVRGVTFFYLDGGGQDFPWMLDHQSDPGVRAKIDNLLAQYRAAGVNWIRLLVATNHFPNQADIHPVPTQNLIAKVNNFMAITRNGPNAGKFLIELVLLPQTSGGMFTDTDPYTRDKLWYKTWIDNLNYANLGIVMFGGDLTPCLLSGCEGDFGADMLVVNHGRWIRSLWAWKQANYPTLNASYEVIGVQDGSNNSPVLISKVASWINLYTPSNPIVAASLYLTLPPGSSWVAYANALTPILDSYHATSGKVLWIDEFGRSVSPSAGRTEADQAEAYAGFLGASVCWRQNRYPKFAWVAGNDYPYNNTEWFGLVSSFTGNVPTMRPAWSSVGLYYNLANCP